MTFRLGLTGSIGMGKSTTGRLFAEEGCALWDADAAVHRLYQKGGAAVEPLSKVFPQAIVEGEVSRDKLKELIAQDECNLKKLEEIVHPLVAKDRDAFLSQSTAEITVLDIPLLYETGTQINMDAVVVVTVDPVEQQRRLIERGRMTPQQLATIIKQQAPNSEKLKRADYIIETDTIDHARQQVRAVIKDVRERHLNA